jgi:hypothetical protein
VLEGLEVRVLFLASPLPFQEGHVGLVRERWGDGAVLYVETKLIDPVLGRVGRGDDKARVFRVGDETESRLSANRLWRNWSVCC